MNWPRIMQKIKALKLRTPFFHGLSYALQKEALPIPENLLTSLRPSSINERALSFLFKYCVTEAPQPKVSYFFTWLGYAGIHGKLQLLREKILPTPFELEIKRGISSPSGYLSFVIFHPFFLLIRGCGFAFKALWRLFR